MAKVLLACEKSQATTKELRRLGHEAYSCDIQECSGENPEWHIQDDVLNHLSGWDIIIAHPPCTYLTCTGNRWFAEDHNRYYLRECAIDFFMAIANADCECIAIENPVGCMSTEWRKPDQIVQPYMFGDPYEKTTCLWLKGLPLLQPTDIVKPEPRVIHGTKSLPKWYTSASAETRSKTFPGMAKAMAEQWTEPLGDSLIDQLWRL